MRAYTQALKMSREIEALNLSPMREALNLKNEARNNLKKEAYQNLKKEIIIHCRAHMKKSDSLGQIVELASR